MAKYNLYTPFTGVRDAFSLLTFINDKKKCQEALKVVAALDGRIAEINEAIETYGKATKMDALLASAEQKDRDAQKALKETNETVVTIQKEATAWADELRRKLIEREKTVEEGQTALAAGEAKFKSRVAAWEVDMKLRTDKMTSDEHAAGALLNEAKAMKKKMDDARENMKAQAASV